jgi:5-methyltetrahydrofolate--homocysteine methyltransferase
MMVASSGFEVTDLGVDVAPEAFVKAAQENNATVVALSALLTTTMPMMKKTIDAIRESSLGNTVKILVGGAPVTQAFADEIGADGYAADAGSATKLAKSFV